MVFAQITRVRVRSFSSASTISTWQFERFDVSKIPETWEYSFFESAKQLERLELSVAVERLEPLERGFSIKRLTPSYVLNGTKRLIDLNDLNGALAIERLERVRHFHSSTAMKRQGDAPPCLINRGRMIIFTRSFEILSQSTRHLQPAMDFLINAP
jgi:hypothetical protein